MNQKQIVDTIEKLDISTFPIPLKIKTMLEPDGTVKVGTQLEVVNVETNQRGLWPAEIDPVAIIINPETATEESVVRTTRTTIMNALSHEVAEHLKFNGKLLDNPHP
jgi:hypothetical protein